VTRASGSRSDLRAASRIERGLEEHRGTWDRLLERPLLWGLLAVVGCTWLLLPRLGSNLPDWEPGDVATFDVVVPRDLTVPDEAATEAMREEARESVRPVYDVEPTAQLELSESIRGLFGACRAQMEGDDGFDTEALRSATDLRLPDDMLRVLEQAECDVGLETALVEIVASVYRTRIVDDALALERRGAAGLVLRNPNTGTERPATLADVAGVIDSRTGVEPLLRTLLLERDAVQRSWIRPSADFLEANLVPNLLYSRGETADRVRRAGDSVAPRSQVFRRGQVLVRRGDTVTPTVARTLYEIERERRDLTHTAMILGIGLLVAVMAVGWWRILGRFGVEPVRSRLSVIFLLLLVFVGLNRLGLFLAEAVALSSHGASLAPVNAYLWALPYAAGPATVCLLLGVQPAVLFALCNALMAGVMLGGDFAVVVYSLASGMVGALAAPQFTSRASLGRVGGIVGLTNLVVMLILELYRGLPELPEAVALAAVSAFIGGPLSVAVASSLLPILESVFGITTDVRLLELSNQNLPLLKRLSLEAPGTYQHSLAVGNLAEAGADAIGANALLLRVCAYYHDVGKLVKPSYFVENQRGVNPHDSLSPSMSALVIMSHVKEGLEMARRANLPLPIRQSIATHHGTKLIKYFYARAREKADPGMGEVRESDYRYPGPRPHTKELGVLLLADAVEAAARTLEQPTPGKIRSMIGKIFADVMEDGQLDDCDLTFSEVDKVASAFMWVLTNMYHHRIDYPGFDFNRRQERRDASADEVGAKAVTAGR
jgi:putative nucleotidyltransferase with HDIG domain